jgi:hypothetical protein
MASPTLRGLTFDIERLATMFGMTHHTIVLPFRVGLHNAGVAVVGGT